jgi:NAD(P)-dependent dehydrogenase (short-subunit alcohol dehydrogenase family)
MEEAMQLEGKTAIVTGAGRGIGRAIALAFAREGAAVALASRTQAQLEETAAMIREKGGKCLVVPADVTDPEAVQTMVGRTEADLGPVDILMNNAGSFHSIGPVTEANPQLWWRDVTINLFGVFLCCRTVIEGMLARGSGRILNMIGGGTAAPFPYGSGYASSKAAVMRFTECLSMEVADTPVKVFAMGPGLVRTAMTELQLDTEAGKKWMGRIADMFATGRDVPPERAAGLAVALASGRCDELAGRMFNVTDDLEQVLARKDDILERDLKTLRIR